MKRYLILLTAATLFFVGTALHAEPPTASIGSRAATLAASLANACPVGAYDSETAFQACSAALRTLKLPLQPAIAWGGDQPGKQIKKKGLTHFNSQVFQTLYLPLFAFTGRWSLDEDKRSHSPIVRLEAFFRNGLPAGDFPYPFWHSSEKWHAYEAANELRFYLDPHGQIFVVTRDAAGSEERRGAYSPATTPAFDGAWQWRDGQDNLQPHVSLFSARYRQSNPYLTDLDATYRSFALRMRDQSCLDCHTPGNKAEQDRLVLLQTPLHAAGEIDNVVKAVKAGEMPQDDIGLPKQISAEDRAAILHAAMAFRDKLTLADKWEAVRTK